MNQIWSEAMIGDLRPLFKYAGGKGRYLTHISKYLGPTHTYVEPFFGAGSVYCYMYNRRLAKKYVINDKRPDIIGIYQAVRDDPVIFAEEVADLIATYKSLSPGQQEAMFIKYRDDLAHSYSGPKCVFVRKCNFSGITTDIGNGEFNERSGHNKQHMNPVSFDKQQVFEWSKALESADISCGDFEKVSVDSPNSIIFADPPYYKVKLRYGDFSKHDQLRCLNWCVYLAMTPSNTVLLSNKDTDRFFSRRISPDVEAIHYDTFYSSGKIAKSTESLFVWNKRSESGNMQTYGGDP